MELHVRERVAYLDYARIVAAFLVIYGHLYTYSDDNFVRIFIYEFHLAFFFLISGMLHKHLPVIESIKKYFQGILLPVFWFCFLFFIFTSITYYYGWDGFKSSWSNSLVHSDYSSLVVSYIKVIINNFYKGEGMVNGPTWFLVSLFYCKIFTDLLQKYKSAIAMLLVVLFYCLCIRYHRNLWIANALMAMPFFLIGFYAKKEINKFLEVMKPIVGIIVGFALTFFLTKMNGPVSMWTINWGRFHWLLSVPLFYLAGLSGSLMVLSFAKTLGAGNNYSELGGNSLLVILGMQFFFVYISDTLLGFNHNYFYSLIIAIIIMILCIFSYMLIQKYFPFIIGKQR